MLPNAAQGSLRNGLLADLVADLKQNWRNGSPIDLAAIVDEYPELLAERSLLVDLAYEKYCLAEESGSLPNVESICRELPAHQSYFLEVVRGHRMLVNHPELLSEPTPDWPVPGDSFDGLSLVRELGRGAFAHVFLAIDLNAGNRCVVLKLSQLPSAEAHALGPIDHQHVVGVLWSKRVNGLHAVCMPYVGATTLRDVVSVAHAIGARRTAQSLIDVIEQVHASESYDVPARSPVIRGGAQTYAMGIVAIAARIAGALAHLHRKGICHGDLKPSNVIVGTGAFPYLIDFNLATITDDAELRYGGTLPYMAPERIRLMLGESVESAPADRADVYSFGAMVFECLTGKVPFVPAEPTDIKACAAELLVQQSKGIPPLASVRPAIPQALIHMIQTCLETDPRRRPSMEEVEKALNWLLSKSIRRSARIAGATLLVLCGLVAWPLINGAAEPGVVETNQVPNSAGERVPTDPFERGVALIRKGNFTDAALVFGEIRENDPDGRIHAYMAYCYTRRGMQEVAAQYYAAALDKGFEPGWVHNNRAYALVQLGRNAPDQLKKALAHVSRAREISPEVRAIQFNWTFIRFLNNVNPKTRRLDDPECVDELQKVMAVGPYDAELYYKASLILATSRHVRTQYGDQAMAFLRKAVELGKKPKFLAADPMLKANLTGAELRELTRMPPANRAPVPLHIELANPAP